MIPILGDILSFAGQGQANAQNMEIAREQMAFQERMSSTAYQRATEDMRKAGLNPMLAYMQGGADAPGGSSAHMENVFESAGGSSALEVFRTQQDIAESKSRMETQQSQALLNSASAAVQAQTARKLEAEIPETEVKKWIWKRLDKWIPAIDKFVDSLGSSAKNIGEKIVPDALKDERSMGEMIYDKVFHGKEMFKSENSR